MESILFIISFFSSKFYIFDSGLPQPSHIILSFLIFYFVLFNREIVKDNYTITLSLFLFYVTLVNLIWAISTGSNTYIVSIVFWIFNFLTFISLINIKNIKFEIIQKTILISFIIIFSSWLLGFGRYNFSPRYNFFFNDPNQLAFWVLCSLSIYLIKPDKKSVLVLLLGFFIILTSMSRSAILGLFVIIFGYMFSFKVSVKDFFIKIFSIIFLIIGVSSILLFNSNEFEYIVDRFTNTDVDDQADIRGYTALLKYPEYLFFGAGQGQYDRFSATNHEIHSTWAGIFFYYGIIGLFLFFCFLLTIFRKLSTYEKFIFMAPLIYGFSTYGVRNSIFWFFIAMYIYYIKTEKV